MARGRFAPSPTGLLHLGNLRTALAAWCSALSNKGDFIIRFEDLDIVTSKREFAVSQRVDLALLGIHSAEEPVFQSERFEMYNDAISDLEQRGVLYECFCTRKDIAQAAAAPHGPAFGYPGTCRSLSEPEKVVRRREKSPALRLRSEAMVCEFSDQMRGVVRGPADDVVIRRNDGVPSYNIAVVVDDALQGITEVVRGDDLVDVTPTQVLLQQLLALPTPMYAHVPLVHGNDGERLAKRHGTISLSELVEQGVSVAAVCDYLFESLGCSTPEDFTWETVPRERWTFSGDIRGNIGT